MRVRKGVIALRHHWFSEKARVRGGAGRRPQKLGRRFVRGLPSLVGGSAAQVHPRAGEVVLVNDVGDIVQHAERNLWLDRERRWLEVSSNHQSSHDPRSV